MQLKAQEEDSQSSTRSEPLKKTPGVQVAPGVLGSSCREPAPGVFLQRASWCKGGSGSPLPSPLEHGQMGTPDSGTTP